MKYKDLNHKEVRIFLVVLFINLVSIQVLFSQSTEKQLDDLINDGNFEKAILVGDSLLNDQPDNPDLNFKLGYCYLNCPVKKIKSIDYLEKANEIYAKQGIQNAKTIETNFYLGQAYHKNYKFDKAIELFSQMKTELKNNEILLAIENEIKQCNTGKLLVKEPVKMQVTNLGALVNSGFSDHSPVLSADETVLIFTSKRKRFENEQINPNGQYNEDIYISNFDGTGWSKPVGISNNINTNAHEASIGLSADGQQLLIYSEVDGGTISISTLIGDEWSAPIDVGSNINTKSRETSASISADGNSIYFTSDRPGGYGGLDIYVSNKLPDESWGKAINLGPAINTEKDEEGPFIHPDGVTLYFSSKGQETMGGLDIFMSRKNEFNTWSKPQNMGYPVNTTEDDVFFTMTPDGKRAYFASFREEGSGNMDIYMMGLPEAEEIPLTIVKGEVTACKSDMANVQIKVYQNGKDSIIGLYKPNSKTGKYLFILSRGQTYQAIYEIAGKEVQREFFEIEKNADFQILYKHIKLKGSEPCDEYVGINDDENNTNNDFIGSEEKDGNVFVENVMFRVNTYEIGNFEQNLLKLVKYLKKNPEAKLEITGYSDTQGPEAYNINLAQQRAEAIYKYLVKNGVNKKQLTYKGDGFKKQITINNYKDGSYVWQSLPYNRRVEFNIKNDPSKKLHIKQFKIPKIYDITKGTLTEEDYKEYEKVFTIQVGAFSKPLNASYFQQLKNIQMFYNTKLYHYTIGEFNSVEEASEELKKVYELGYKDAFIRNLSYFFPKKTDNQLSADQNIH
jgi:outer membrane protein OmpA-like peptidoglycan-associated protein/Tol biopolymer transport system component